MNSSSTLDARIELALSLAQEAISNTNLAIGLSVASFVLVNVVIVCLISYVCLKSKSKSSYSSFISSSK